MDNEIRLGTWNVITLLRPGSQNELLDVLARCKADITALQEMRCGGSYRKGLKEECRHLPQRQERKKERKKGGCMVPVSLLEETAEKA